MSSNVDEKRQFLNFVHSNLKLDSGKVLWKLREPFSTLVEINDQPLWLQLAGTLRTFNWKIIQQEKGLLKPYNVCGYLPM